MCADNYAPSDPSPLPATRTAITQELLYRRIALAPQAIAGFTMLWDNWCQPFKNGTTLIVRLTLTGADTTFEFPVDIDAAPRCNGTQYHSSIGITYYSGIAPDRLR